LPSKLPPPPVFRSSAAPPPQGSPASRRARDDTMVGLSEGEKHFIRGGIAQDLRADGRRRLQFRALTVETGIIPQVCEESARLPSGLLPWLNLFSDWVVVLVGQRLGAC
uniref:Uncharacterized protein n=1 Tax=Aegilops tauschii subsp. strangulata TaxID=200361 RepID=A0A453RZ61_AEGTS